MAYLVMLNNFMHDFSAAAWLAGTIVLWLVLRASEAAGDPTRLVREIVGAMRVLMAVALFGIVVLGGIRAAAYKAYEWNAAAGDGQVTLLLVKHGVFTGLFVPGLIVLVRARRLLRRAAP